MNEQMYALLESQVLEWLLVGEDSVLIFLRQQLASSKIESRELTGVGFYLNIRIPSITKRLHDIFKVKHDFCFGDMGALLESDNHNQEVGFLLWIKDGYLDSLEAYTYGFEKWPEEVNYFRLFYSGDKHDLGDLRRNWML